MERGKDDHTWSRRALERLMVVGQRREMKESELYRRGRVERRVGGIWGEKGNMGRRGERGRWGESGGDGERVGEMGREGEMGRAKQSI